MILQLVPLRGSFQNFWPAPLSIFNDTPPLGVILIAFARQVKHFHLNGFAQRLILTQSHPTKHRRGGGGVGGEIRHLLQSATDAETRLPLLRVVRPKYTVFLDIISRHFKTRILRGLSHISQPTINFSTLQTERSRHLRHVMELHYCFFKN